MKEIGRYDTELQMFVETPKPIKTSTLEFLRWLAEKQGRVVSEPCGEFALAAAIIKAPSGGQNNGKMDTKS